MDFEKRIEKDIDERQAVLFEIERVLFTGRYNISKKHLDIFTIQSISMIYSVWEGFIQTSFNLYIDAINEKELEPSLLNDELYIYNIENNFKQLFAYPQKQNKKIDFLSKLKDHFLLESFKLNRGVNTQNNVGFDVINGLLKLFCINPFEEHWKQYRYPNPNLKETLAIFLKYRNSVSHGGDITSEEKVTREVFTRYKNLVYDLMIEIQNKMVYTLKESKYIKVNDTKD